MLESFFEIIGDVSAQFHHPPAFHFALAGDSFRVYAESTLLQQQLVTALRHRVVDPVDQPDLIVYAWNKDPSPLARALPDWRVMERWTRREAVRASDEMGMVYFDPDGGTVSLYDKERRQAGIWFSGDGVPPIWTVAAPLLRLIDAWVTERGKILCHGAAIVKHGGAALIIGPGGVGKSTLALRALDASFDYLGDDYVLLEPASPVPVIHSVYCSGKLLGADVEDGVPARTAIFRRPDHTTDKAFLCVVGSSVLSSAPLVAVVEPCIGDNDRPWVETISRGEALRAILPSSLRQLSGNEQRKLTILTRLLTVPCVRLHLSRDHARNLAAIDELLLAQTDHLGLEPCVMKG